MTIAGIAGLIMQTPGRALIDRTNRKQAIVIAEAVAMTLSCPVLPFISNFYLVAVTQSIAGVAEAIFSAGVGRNHLGHCRAEAVFQAHWTQ